MPTLDITFVGMIMWLVLLAISVSYEYKKKRRSIKFVEILALVGSSLTCSLGILAGIFFFSIAIWPERYSAQSISDFRLQLMASSIISILLAVFVFVYNTEKGL